MEYTLKKTIWICSKGHVKKVSQDLGDPADAVIVARIQEQMWNGCPHTNNGIRCGEDVKRTVEFAECYC